MDTIGKVTGDAEVVQQIAPVIEALQDRTGAVTRWNLSQEVKVIYVTDNASICETSIEVPIDRASGILVSAPYGSLRGRRTIGSLNSRRAAQSGTTDTDIFVEVGFVKSSQLH